jgi:hypothetical protein
MAIKIASSIDEISELQVSILMKELDHQRDFKNFQLNKPVKDFLQEYRLMMG